MFRRVSSIGSRGGVSVSSSSHILSLHCVKSHDLVLDNGTPQIVCRSSTSWRFNVSLANQQQYREFRSVSPSTVGNIVNHNINNNGVIDQRTTAKATPSPGNLSIDQVSDPIVADIVRAVVSQGGKSTFNKLINSVGSKTKDAIFRSGKGVEGFIRAIGPAVAVVEDKGIKYIVTSVVVPLVEDPVTTPAAVPTMLRRSSASDSPSNGGAIVDENEQTEGRGLLPSVVADSPLTLGELRALERVALSLCAGQYKIVNDIYNTCRIRSSSYDEFLKYVKGCGQFWVVGSSMRIRQQGEMVPPKEDAYEAPSRPTTVPFAKVVPSLANNWGGWGSQGGVPTPADVYEVLKYVPVHWGNLGALNLPAAIKKKHVRIASVLQWLRRQPKFFEVRNIAGTLEVRRAVILHPDQHGKTQEEADRWLDDRISSGEHNGITTNADVGTGSQAATAIYKFLVRVTPGYFVAPELLFMRYTKKGLLPTDLIIAVKEHPSIFETMHLPDASVLIRRRTGADSNKWRAEFEADMLSVPADVQGLVALMGRSSVCWDRPEYLYVRLLDSEKVLVGGYEGMLAIMRRHPLVFRMGTVYFRRVDASDPANDDEEPATLEERTLKKVEENVYQGHRDVATVFHYVAPDDSVVNVSQLAECASPAIHAVLPPRIVTVLQMFPDLFHCKETAPGVYTVRKVVVKASPLTNKQSQIGLFHKNNSGVSKDIDNLDDMLMDESDGDTWTRKETIAAVKGLIPSRGADVGQLGQWLSMPLRKNVNAHFDSLQGLLEANSQTFRIDGSNMVTVVTTL